MRSHPRVVRATITTPNAPAMPVASRRELLKLLDNREPAAPTPARPATVVEIRRAWNTCAGSRLRIGRGLPSLRVAAAMSEMPATQEASAVAISIDEQREIAECAEPRCAHQAIEIEPSSVGRQAEIAAPARSGETPLAKTDEEQAAPIVSRETVSDCERSTLPTFKQAQDAHAREFLTRVLTATGGERKAAARLAGIGRTHMQALVKRYAISIPMDPKKRGRRRRERCET